jgi:hypothetical protein
MVIQNRQVFWLKHHHSQNLPGFPVVYLREFNFYSGVTAWDFTQLTFSPIHGFANKTRIGT